MINIKGCKVDRRQLAIGKKIEMEHTNNPKIAEMIARQHLCEFKGQKYYTALRKLEMTLEK